MIREDWVEVELEKICSIYDNMRKPVNNSERNKRILGKNKSELYPYYGATGLVGYIDDYLFEGEFVLVGEDAAPFFDYKKDVAYMIKGKTWVNNHAHILKSFFNNKFLCLYLNQFNYQGYVSGTTRLKLTQGSLKKIPIKVAPLPEQRAIVAKIEELFSELDSGIESLNKAKKQLEIYRQAVLKAAFEGKLTREWRKENSKRISNWKNYKIGEILETIDGDRGKNYPKKHEYLDDGYCLFLSTKNVLKGEFKFDETVFISKEKDKVLRGGKLERKDLVITTRGTLGNVAYYDSRVLYENIRINSGMLILRIHNHDLLNPIYLMRFINSSLFIQQLRRKQSGTAQPQIPARVLKEIEIMLPDSIGEQEEIIKEIESRLSVCENIESNIEEALEKAEGLRQSILKKAFEGKLLSKEELEACKQEEDWEPAEGLLKRIQEANKGVN